MDVQALIDRCEDEHAQPQVTYKAIWPGQPGGYEPKVAGEMAAEAKKLGNLEGKTPGNRPKRVRVPSGFQSMNGLSAKADEAVRNFKARGVAMEERRKKAQEGKSTTKKSKARAA